MFNLKIFATLTCQNALKQGRNLLAFSHGVDSTALFYILINNDINFDIAIVDYNVRAQSKLEIKSAKELASKFNKQIFIKSVTLKSANFEHCAREARYKFFAEICKDKNYKNLILAHQLNDRFEWLLMQLGRGAGLNELLGMSEVEKRDDFTLIRPLLNFTKSELLAFLDERKLKYFIDESNFNQNFSRNFIRQNFSEPFLAKFSAGVIKSFKFLQDDALKLSPKIAKFNELYIAKNDENVLRAISLVCKKFGVVISAAQRDEAKRCLDDKKDFVLSAKIAVGYKADFIFLAPFIKTPMSAEFKELCRLLKVPKIVRAYIFKTGIKLGDLKEFL